VVRLPSGGAADRSRLDLASCRQGSSVGAGRYKNPSYYEPYAYAPGYYGAYGYGGPFISFGFGGGRIFGGHRGR
jgi:hypothetical protein